MVRTSGALGFFRDGSREPGSTLADDGPAASCTASAGTASSPAADALSLVVSPFFRLRFFGTVGARPLLRWWSDHISLSCWTWDGDSSASPINTATLRTIAVTFMSVRLSASARLLQPGWRQDGHSLWLSLMHS